MSFYCEKIVTKGRSSKTCRFCEGNIPKGTTHYVVPSECFESSIPLCLSCYKWLEDNGYEDITNLPEYDPKKMKRKNGDNNGTI